MKNILLAVMLVLVGCKQTPNNPEAWMEREINACLPSAIIFKKTLNKYGVWSEVFRYSYYDDKKVLRGHAMVVFEYPKGKNQLWTYDEKGSYRIIAKTNDIGYIAEFAHRQRNLPNKALNAIYIK
jgi:hypothetical protein